MSTTWEYKTLKVPTSLGLLSGTDFDSDRLAELLNAQGMQGWELVSVVHIEKVKGGTKCIVAVMKRPTA
jgi:hypothetical protein